MIGAKIAVPNFIPWLGGKQPATGADAWNFCVEVFDTSTETWNIAF